ncbi:MAG: MFS transporter [Planctomycetes bacterium]|nr:MFS transporter [Planctomycetota bacterium]
MTDSADDREAWHRNFRAVWPSLFATSLGLMAFLPMLPLYIQERFAIADERELAHWAAAIFGVAPLTAAIAGPIWGALGDRVGKKPMAIRANLAIAIATGLMPLAPSPLWLLVMRILQGAFAGFIAPSMALASHGAPRELHGTIIARLQVAMAVGTFLGPFLGAELSHHGGRASVFWMTSLMTALAAARLAITARDAPPAPPDGRSFLGGMAQSSRDLLQNRVFRWLLVLVVVMRLGQNMAEPFVALVVRGFGPASWIGHFSATPELALDRTVGVAFGMMAVAQWFFTPVWGRMADRRGPLRCLAYLCAMLGAILATMAMVTSIDAFLALRALAAAVMAGSMTLAFAATSKRVAEARRTLAFSMVQSCMQLGYAFGSQLGALVATAFVDGPPDFRLLFLTAAACCLLAATGMFMLRRLPAGGDG